MTDATANGKSDPHAVRPAGPYWDDPVYRYVSRRHRSAQAAGEADEAERCDALMQQLAGGSMPDDLYWRLDAEARADRRRRKQRRRRTPRPTHPPPADEAPSVNVADLKKRIFNPQVSRENVIKALEALPAGERKAIIAGLPPGLRRKLADYLKGRGQ
jgi:hypothetical protein